MSFSFKQYITQVFQGYSLCLMLLCQPQMQIRIDERSDVGKNLIKNK